MYVNHLIDGQEENWKNQNIDEREREIDVISWH
jgi:hypothetical protein